MASDTQPITVTMENKFALPAWQLESDNIRLKAEVARLQEENRNLKLEIESWHDSVKWFTASTEQQLQSFASAVRAHSEAREARYVYMRAQWAGLRD